jgi:hypothetical protein
MRSEGFALLLLLACSATTNQPLNSQQLASFQACSATSDCVLETNGCCCAFAAINKTRQTEFRAQFACSVVCDCAFTTGTLCPVCAQSACTTVTLDAGSTCPQ